jgi:hypothetical protein
MSAIAAAAMCLSLALGGESIPGAAVSELGGRLVEQQTGEPLPMPMLTSVRAFDGDTCVAQARVDDSGHYALRMTPGTYWVQVLQGDTEIAAEQVSAEPGSWTRDIAVTAPENRSEPSLVAQSGKAQSAGQSEGEGIGGSGTAGQEDPLLPPLPPSPTWLEDVMDGALSPVRPPWAPPFQE